MRNLFNLSRVSWALLAALAVGGAAPACSDAPPNTTIEILHWWKKGGEADAISALLADFKRQYPNIDVNNNGLDGSKMARDAIISRMTRGLQPDTFQANGGWDLMAWVLYNNDPAQNKMQAIDIWAQDWIQKVPKAVLESVSYAGHVYAVPLNIHRVNTLFYNKAIFDRFGIDADELSTLQGPAGLVKLFEAADKIKQYNQQLDPSDPRAKSITPIALGYGQEQTWTLALVFFENILVAHLGAEGYEKLFREPKPLDAFSQQMINALEDLRKLVSYTSNASSVVWDRAMDMVLNEDAAMTIMGDWGKGYANAAHFTEQDFGIMPTPGTAGTFVFTTDTFGLPLGARHAEDAVRMLKVFGSKDGQDIFNVIKGSISVRTDSAIEKYDQMSQKTYGDFTNPDTKVVAATSILAQQVYLDAISEALGEFAKDGNEGSSSMVQHTLQNYYDVLRSSCWPTCPPPQ
jgi:glucose/mannose transport system substrate-binding protein